MLRDREARTGFSIIPRSHSAAATLDAGMIDLDALMRAAPGHDVDLPDVRVLFAPREPWRAQAACAGADPAIFFPARGASTEPARAICARCPVAEPCLDHALAYSERHGIWGGTTGRDRRRLREADARTTAAS